MGQDNKMKGDVMMEKIKQIAKYLVNILVIINALVLALDPIWNIPCADKITATIIALVGVVGTYLLGTKVVNTIVKGKE